MDNFSKTLVVQIVCFLVDCLMDVGKVYLISSFAMDVNNLRILQEGSTFNINFRCFLTAANIIHGMDIDRWYD